MFLLDSNVLINASRTYYAPDIAPTFWEWLEAQHTAGAIASIARVKKEIDDGREGHLRTWAASLPRTFWIAPDDQTGPSASRHTAWVMHPDRLYSAAAREEFLGIADYLLVAQAHALGAEVVTFELPAPNSRRRIRILDACNAIRVPYREPFGIYRRLGLRFS